ATRSVTGSSSPTASSRRPGRRGGARQNRGVRDWSGHGDELLPGLYDTIIDRALAERIDALAARRLKPRRDSIEPAELPDRIAEVIAGWVREVLAAVPEHERAEIALTVAARVLDVPVETGRPGDLARRRLDPKLRRLL